MREALRPQFLNFLSSHGLKPRTNPRNWRKIAKANKDRMVRAAQEKGDHYMVEALEESYRAALKDSRHPTDRQLASLSDWVEGAIRKSGKYAGKFSDNVYVGDFPTGTFNAQVTTVEGGYLVLVNSGASVLIRTVYSLLASAPHLDGLSADDAVVSAMGEVFRSYLRHGDPMYGPLNQAFGSDALLAVALTHACYRFMVAHEYAHILAGHLDRPQGGLRTFSGQAGGAQASETDYRMELEADLIAYELLVGTDQPSQIDTAVFRQAEAGNGTAIAIAMEQAALIVAPLLFLAIDLLMQRVASSFQDPNAGFERSATHPSTVERMQQIIGVMSQAPAGTKGFLSYGVALRTIGDLLEEKARGNQACA